jgi:hypothetical protein
MAQLLSLLLNSFLSNPMTLQLDFKNSDLLSLEDAIAYEFFMDSASNIMHSANEKNLDIVEQVAKLATASYLIAHIFCEARSANSQQTNDIDA